MAAMRKLFSLFSRKPADLSVDFLQGRHPYDALDGDLGSLNQLDEILPALRQIMAHTDVISTSLYTDGAMFMGSLYVMNPQKSTIGSVYIVTGIGVIRHIREVNGHQGIEYLQKDEIDIKTKFDSPELVIPSRCADGLARYAAANKP